MSKPSRPRSPRLTAMDEMRLSPKLVVDDGPGGADRAIDFYREVLGAEVDVRHVMGADVVFARLLLPGGGELHLKDADGVDPGPPPGGGGHILDIVCADPDSVVARAVDQGAEVVFAVADQPYGSRQGRFRDPFGHQWIVGTPIAMSEDAVQGALDAWADDPAGQVPQ